MRTLDQSLRAGIETLTRVADGSPRLTAETLLMFVLGSDRAHLFAHPEHILTVEEELKLESAFAQRLRGVPTQYITGRQEFWGMDFMVSPAVLIPRPETEHLIETVLELAGSIPSPDIVDVGTGSGCIALALARELPSAEIHAVDISSAALEVARSNASRLGLQERVRFQQSDLLHIFSGELASFDFVVSNPPYVSELERESLQPEVRDFEPHAALFAGKTGLDVIQHLIPQAERTLKHGAWLVMEIGQGQDAALRELLSGWEDVRFVEDLRGIDRVVAAQRG